MEFLLVMFVLGYVVFKLSSLASQPKPEKAEEPKTKKEPKKPEPKPIPQPTREEQAAAAKDKYDRALRMIEAAAMDATERDAAKEKAKQTYLKELDGVI